MNEPNENKEGGGTAEFFRQVIVQLSALWQKLSFQQKLITASLVGITLVGLIGLLFFAHSSGGGKGGGGSGGMRVLYSELSVDEAARITEQLGKGGYKYKLENDGRNILVNQKQLYEIRMALAREGGLPKQGGLGNELILKTSLGTTESQQEQQKRIALEGELQRTIEDMDEVKSARVHLVTPKPSVFIEEKREATASVVLRFMPGRDMTKEQIRGITYLVASSVEGLKPQHVSVIDAVTGEPKTNPFQDEGTATSTQNREIQQNVERTYVRKVKSMLADVLGYSKSTVTIDVNLDFDQVEKTIETFDAENPVVRSIESQEENTKNAPDGDHQKERSLTNYEISKVVQRVVQERGSIRKMTVSVAIDGKYETAADGKRTYVERSPADMQKIEALVQTAVGYDLARGDQITVTSMQFDNELMEEERQRLSREEKEARLALYIKLVLAVIAGVAFLLLIRSIARAVTEAMNPPVPVLEQLGLEDMVEEEEPSEADKKASEILAKVELLTSQAPVNIAAIIKQWLVEDVQEKNKK
ncbi:flagellar M-ring protein FliF [Fibrobacteres bacterium R8-0-B4]